MMGFCISERYLRFLFRCQLVNPANPTSGQTMDLIDVLSDMCDNNGFQIPGALHSAFKRTIVIDTSVAILLGILSAPEQQFDNGAASGHDHSHEHGHDHGHDHGHGH
jgi:hypothetical protein